MSHTPTPWDDKTVIQIPPYKQAAIMPIQTRIMSEDNYQRSMACVNACEGMEDPTKWFEDVSNRLDNITKDTISVLAAKDTEIAQLKARVKELETVMQNTIYETTTKAQDIDTYDSAEGAGALTISHLVEEKLLSYAYPPKPQQ